MKDWDRETACIRMDENFLIRHVEGLGRSDGTTQNMTTEYGRCGFRDKRCIGVAVLPKLSLLADGLFCVSATGQCSDF